jgi:iron(II)-dependent oxidoreductase
VPAVAQENGITLTTAVPAVAQVNDTIPTLSGLQQLQTAEAQLTIAAVTQAVANLTATQNMISNANATGTAAQLALTETAAYATLFALTPSPLELALDRATNFTGTNDDWKALYPNGFVQTFNGVEMVLVPKGFFLMGSDNENLGYKTCFTPYWIGRYEITNLQYGSTGRYTGNNRPREYVTWFEARDFCQSKNSRLPTGAEWEYAARGVSNWVYPWGNNFATKNAVFDDNSGGKPAVVGSRPGGVAWIGAQDLSGNIWEWTSSWYRDYPYAVNDGREGIEDSNNNYIYRVLRGGSFVGSTDLLQTANRFRNNPDVANYYRGFRCSSSIK